MIIRTRNGEEIGEVADLGDGDAVAAEYTGLVAEEVRGEWSNDQVIAIADCAAAHRRQDAGTVYADMQAGLTRDGAQQARSDEKQQDREGATVYFPVEPENEAFRFQLQFKKSHVSRDELIRTLREILAQLEGTTEADSTAA